LLASAITSFGIAEIGEPITASGKERISLVRRSAVGAEEPDSISSARARIGTIDCRTTALNSSS
jgi:hypothetical protein